MMKDSVHRPSVGLVRIGPVAQAWLFSLLVVVFALLLQGQDANWDLRNYHLYNAIAWVDGRMAFDVAPAQLQSWHNPTLDVPAALAIRAGAPGWAVSAWLAMFGVLAIFFALRVLDLLWPHDSDWRRTAAAACVAIAGAGMWSTAGTTLNDPIVAAAVMAGVWWMLDARGRRAPLGTWLPIGLLAGAAAGLKLTAAVYCIGFVAAASVAGPARQALNRLFALAVGGVVAFVATAGPWMWTMWTLHANPLFPYFNQWFHSPDALPVSWGDARFQPRNAVDALLVPLKLLKNSGHFSEVKLADPRLFLGWLVLAGTTFVVWRRRRVDGNGARDQHLWWSLLAFCVVSYGLWVALYSIYRYALPLELLSSVLIVGWVSARAKPKWRTVALVAVVLVMIAATNRPSWWRQPFRAPMVSVTLPAMPDNALIVMDSSEPIGHVAAFVPRSVPVVALYNNFISPDRCTRLQRRVEAAVGTHAGPIFLARPKDAPVARMRDYGLEFAGPCVPIEDTLMPMELCPLRRVEAVRPGCDAPRPGP